jgi:hypothetical protein
MYFMRADDTSSAENVAYTECRVHVAFGLQLHSLPLKQIHFRRFFLSIFYTDLQLYKMLSMKTKRGNI